MRANVLAALAGAVLLGAAPVGAELCKNCKGKSYIMTVGKCVVCGGPTGSGAFKLCPKCSARLGQCEHCRRPIRVAAVPRPRPRPRPQPRPKPKPGGVDLSRSATYSSGKWKYRLQVWALGSRSEGRFGALYYDDRAVPDAEANDRYKTPWGLLYWNGSRRRFGDHGWMPHRMRGGAGFDRKGKLLAVAPSPAGKPAPIELDEGANGKTVEAEKGQEIYIRLKGNPTTGYSWRAKKLAGTVVAQSGPGQYAQDPARPGMVGVGGRFRFRFDALGIGRETITLVYARPWERNKPPAKTFTVTVTVKPAARPDQTKARAKLLLAEPRSFVLHLYYCGPHDKPYYSLLLLGARPKLPRPGAHQPAKDRWKLDLHVTKRQVEALVAHLAKSGCLREAEDALKDSIAPVAGPCYLLRVTGGPKDKRLDLRLDLGWGKAMFARLDALRAVLFGPAADAMDRLLARLSGHRKKG